MPACVIEFNEDDFDNDLDFSFDCKHESIPRKRASLSTTEAHADVTADVAHVIHFNEDDFENDLDFDFDTPKINKTDETPSSAVSWPPSSYIRTSPQKSPIQVKAESYHAQIPSALSKRTELDRAARTYTTTSNLHQEGSSPPPIKRPRTLPWMKGASTTPQHRGPRTVCSRPFTSVAVKDEEDEEDERVENSKSARPIAKIDPYEITQSAVKAGRTAAKTRINDKKRSVDDMFAVQKKTKNSKVGVNEVARVFLSAEQRGVIDMLKSGKSVFFTGSAGTGKSVLLRSAIQELKQLYQQPDNVAVTASTGLAACNIGGSTLHSFSGVGIGAMTGDQMLKRVKKKKKNVLRWQKTKVLVIDEISMVDAALYDGLEHVARKIKNVEKPWGGIQLVVTGDFFQLPPVCKDSRGPKFAFEAEKWKCLDATIQLRTVFRQKDEDFVSMLNEMRTGKMSAKTIESFRKLQRPIPYNDGLNPTELFPLRAEVDAANAIQLRRLPGEAKVFLAEDSGSITDIAQRDRLLNGTMATDRLELKKGAQVMLIKNRDDGLVNGSLGVVMGFMNSNTYTFAADEDGLVFNDSVFRDSPWTEEELASMDKSAAGKRKMQKLADMHTSAANQKVWPVVRFKSPNGGQDSTQLMTPESWKTELPNGEIQACRKQVPLILAYAISIHKSQGQTIERVKVNLLKCFEKGQAYVALSRAVSKDGLEIVNFRPAGVMAHARVEAFYRELANAPDAVEQHVTRIKTESKGELKQEVKAEEVPMTTQQVFMHIRNDPLAAYKPSGSKVGR